MKNVTLNLYKQVGCLHCGHIFKTYEYLLPTMYLFQFFYLFRAVLDSINFYTSFCFSSLSDYSRAQLCTSYLNMLAKILKRT